MIATSYFSNKSAPRERKVCIAKGYPRFLPGLPTAKLLAPSNPKAVDWRGAYRADLEARFPTSEALREELERIEAIVRDPILCCYESDPNDCHRSVLAEFIRERLGIDVREWA